MRFGIWRSAMAPSDAAEKNRNIGAQLQSITCIKAPKMFWKIYFLYDFWCACSFRAGFGLPIRNLTIAGSASDMRKFFYIGAHLHSPPYTTAVQFLSNRSTIYTKWCAQTLPSIFGLFAIFNSNFVNIAVM